MIKQVRGHEKITGYKKKASTVFAFNDAVTRDADGFLVRVAADTPRSQILGLIQRDVLATDSDYAAATMVPVLEPHDGAEFQADVAGTATQAMVGLRKDLTDHDTVNVAASAIQAFQIKRVVSSSVVIGKFITEDATA